MRCRDLTCRWPGCDKPAHECDLDHTIPYGDGGPTHASNIKCYCRIHHLVKTFWGWHDKQLPDGTVIVIRYRLCETPAAAETNGFSVSGSTGRETETTCVTRLAVAHRSSRQESRLPIPG